ncbi:hypothetical protein GQ43DRAFT_441956 [Delitschia confertaspora ATCC 74209]|uniref:histidine kinase n=1 Tax=Delitschia confertaspora ATCC 74209 TaxID=1513339 RepID=A0A9P4MRK4_9PLEO|nr:hypothetical protein GQ43DRAFT_441956 [Delitschia confertaspora ATCC 74209]
MGFGSHAGQGNKPPDIIERQSLCLSYPKPGMVLHCGESGFREELLRLYSPAECKAAEQLVQLKDTLRKSDSESFWPILTEGLATITDAQYAFISKRILVDDDNLAVEMPPIGESGSCLMGAAFYFNDGHGTKRQLKNFKYHAYSCPCAHMRHDKIFIIPEKLNEFIINNPNQLAAPGEAYLGIPLFAEGKCFAHFGVMWTAEGAARRSLGWGYLELLLHSLEDMILQRVLEGPNFAKSAEAVQTPQERPLVVSHEAVSAAQSLKPYARSLSHELRTPMQGVVGMLDVMYATVQEAAEGLNDARIRKVLQTLKENIEAVQDSSRRAVEAADNVVHAYDMNMGVPDTPSSPPNGGISMNGYVTEKPSEILVAGNHVSISRYRGTKRRRDEMHWTSGHASKYAVKNDRQRSRCSLSEEPAGHSPVSVHLSRSTTSLETLEERYSHTSEPQPFDCDPSNSPLFASERSVVPGLRHTNLREVLQYVVNDALRIGGRPDSAVASETECGERIEVQTRSSSGQMITKYIEWIVDVDVPETILIDEKDLAKMISCVTLNAIKFTDNGTITLKASLSARSRYIVINVKDSGSGIPAAFIPNLFKPFSREDDSTTRQSEGLGLGLLVAKGLARKLGGDLTCLRSNVAGPEKGSEFEMRVPLTPGDVCSRASTPFGSATPPTKFSISPELTSVDDTGSLSNLPPSVDFRPVPSSQNLGGPSPSRGASPSRPRPGYKSRQISEKNRPFDRSLAIKYPLNFLVVEDNRINRKLLTSMLQKLGYTDVLEAYDGNDAVEKMKVDGKGREIDVILMDLWMPLLDGFQATEAILQMDIPKKPTILAVTADITDGAIKRAEKVGMKGFLTKPFQIRDLEKLICQHALRSSESPEH